MGLRRLRNGQNPLPIKFEMANRAKIKKLGYFRHFIGPFRSKILGR